MDTSTRCYNTSGNWIGILERCACSQTRESADEAWEHILQHVLEHSSKTVNFSLMLPNGGVGVMRVTLIWFLHFLREDLPLLLKKRQSELQIPLQRLVWPLVAPDCGC